MMFMIVGKVSEDWAESVIDARYQIEGRKDSHVKRPWKMKINNLF